MGRYARPTISPTLARLAVIGAQCSRRTHTLLNGVSVIPNQDDLLADSALRVGSAALDEMGVSVIRVEVRCLGNGMCDRG